ncbi:MAG TPA: SWIM zinc finger family protein, partial [Blastocatellia bacterium]
NKIKKAAEIAKSKTNDRRWINAIDKAVAGVESGWWIITELAHGVAVTTECGNTYFANGSCQCKAFQNGQPCKHRALARLVEIASELKEETAPAVSRAQIIANITARVPAQELSYFLQRRFGVTLITSRFLPLGALKQIQAARLREEIEDERLQEFCDVIAEIQEFPDAKDLLPLALAVLKVFAGYTVEMEEKTEDSPRDAPAKEKTEADRQRQHLSDEEADRLADDLFGAAGVALYTDEADELAGVAIKIINRFAEEKDWVINESNANFLNLAIYSRTAHCSFQLDKFAAQAQLKSSSGPERAEA